MFVYNINLIEDEQKNNSDTEPHQIEKLDPDPHQSQNYEALEAQNGAIEGRGRSQWRHVGSKLRLGGFVEQ
jgi:hypothetical protein